MAYDGTLKFDTSLDAGGFQKGVGGMGDIVKGMTAFKLLEKGFQMIVGSIDKAVARYDTLNNFPKVLEKMGYTADDAGAATSKLSAGIDGLPTSLNEVAATAQQLTVMTKNLDKSVDTTLALNNAFLASGSAGEEASRGTEAYIKMLAAGKVDGQHWVTLQQTMGYALNKTAEAFGFAGESAQKDLLAALQDSDITFDQFNSKLIELSTEVGGFAEMAQTSCGGIGTAWSRLQTAVVREVANIIKAIDGGLSQTRFQSIEHIIDVMRAAVVKSLQLLAVAFGFLAKNIVPVTIAIISFIAAVKMATLVSLIGQTGSLTSALLLMQPALLKVTAAKIKDQAATIALHALYIKDIALSAAAAIASKVKTAGIVLETAAENARTGSLFGAVVALGAATVAQWLQNAALLACPLVWIIAAVLAFIAVLAALVVGIIKLVGWLRNKSEAYEEEVEAISAAKDAHEEYKNKLEEDAEAAQKADNVRRSTIATCRDLAGSIDHLIDANDEYGSKNSEIASKVDQLNKRMEGLGLTFGETTNSLNMTGEELSKYFDNLGKVGDYESKQSEYNRLLTEKGNLQQEYNAQLAKQTEYEEMYAKGLISKKEYNELTKEGESLLAEYTSTLRKLGIEAKAAGQAAEKAYDAEAEAAVRAQQIRNNQIDSVKRYAKQYGKSADDIIKEASKMTGGLEEWATAQEGAFTKSGMDLDMLASRWGMTKEQVKGYMDEWGMNAQEFHEEMLNTHTSEGLSLEQLAAKWGTTTEEIDRQCKMGEISLDQYDQNMKKALEDFQNAVTRHKDSIINDFKEIPAQYEMTGEQMIAVLATNRARYGEWQTKMTEISGLVSTETMAELEKLGPGALSAINQMCENGYDGLMRFDEQVNGAVAEATAHATEELKKPDVAEAAGQLPTDMAQAIAGNDALTEAVGQMVTKANEELATQMQAFQQTGAQIVEAVVTGAQGADASGIATGVTAALTSELGNTKAAATNTGTAVQTVFSNMRTQVQSTVQQMMSQTITTINQKSVSVRTAFSNMGNNVVAIMNSLRSRSGSAAMGTANDITSAFNTMVPGATNAANNMMDGISRAMSNKAPGLYAEARDIATNIAKTMSDALQVKSPSRVMIAIFEFVMAGISRGMKNKEAALYRQADDISTEIADRLTLSAGTAALELDSGNLIERLKQLDLTELLGKVNASIDTIQHEVTHRVSVDIEKPTDDAKKAADEQRHNELYEATRRQNDKLDKLITAIKNIDGNVYIDSRKAGRSFKYKGAFAT